MSEGMHIILAAYPSATDAASDFDRLVEMIGSKSIRSDGAILVQRDDDGRVTVVNTGNKLGRKGAGWGGGVGVLVGLAAPPLLASVAVGAVAGGLIGKFAQRRVEGGLEAGLGEKLQPGTAAILTLVAADDLLPAEQALSGLAGEVACRDGRRFGQRSARCAGGRCRQVRSRSNGAAVARSGLRRCRRADDRRVGARLDDRDEPEAAGGRPQRAGGPDRRRRLRQPRHVRRDRSRRPR